MTYETSVRLAICSKFHITKSNLIITNVIDNQLWLQLTYLSRKNNLGHWSGVKFYEQSV